VEYPLLTRPHINLGIKVLDAGEMGGNKDLSDFDNGPIMAKRLGQSIS